MSDDRVPAGGETALPALESYMEANDTESVAWETACELLVEEGYTEAGADDLLTTLELRGYIYTVEDEVRIPE